MTSNRPPALGAFSTLALLKANFDSNHDYIGMFQPFVLDALCNLSQPSVTAQEVANALESRLSIRIPSTAVSALLGRAKHSGIVDRKYGRYWINRARLECPDLESRSAKISAQQLDFGKSLAQFAFNQSGHDWTPEYALEMLFFFLEQTHISLLLDQPIDSNLHGTSSFTPQDLRLTARYIHDVVRQNDQLASTLNQILEGFVLQKCLLLKDFEGASRPFKDLRTFIDTRIILQALGYQGDIDRQASTELITLLRNCKASVEVFQDTVDEIRNILFLYQSRLGSEQGRQSLDQQPLTRYFLQNRWSPSDVATAIATLEHDIKQLGLTISKRPSRSLTTTLNENLLATRLARTDTPELEPRVWHDVNCMAAILTIRQGAYCANWDSAKAVFVTSTGLVVKHATDWWRQEIVGDPRRAEHAVPPIVFSVAIGNYAWIKRPLTSSKIQLSELISLCSAALHPTQETWQRFLGHLRKLQDSGRLTSDEVAFMMASELTQRELASIEDCDDPDATTLDEVVFRVETAYSAKALEAEAKAKELADDNRDLHRRIETNSSRVAKTLSGGIHLILLVILSLIIYSATVHNDLAARIALGILTAANLGFGWYVFRRRRGIQSWMAHHIRAWLLGSSMRPRGA